MKISEMPQFSLETQNHCNLVLSVSRLFCKNKHYFTISYLIALAVKC
jgi:hypothetical protein